MPLLVHAMPKYRKHRASGQAIVTIEGRDFYLGPHGTKASRAEYDRIVGEWLANNRRLPQPPNTDITVNELLAAFWRHAQVRYRRPDGKPSSELDIHRSCLRPVRRLYGHAPVSTFGPLALDAVKAEMEKLGWVRTSINKHIGRIKRVFRWGVSKELIPASVLAPLESVEGLALGHTDAPESEEVQPVADHAIEAVRKAVSSQIRAMIDLQVITAMRPGEMVSCGAGTSTPLARFGNTNLHVTRTPTEAMIERSISASGRRTCCGHT